MHHLQIMHWSSVSLGKRLHVPLLSRPFDGPLSRLSPEIILNGLSKDDDVAGGGRHMSNHFAKPEVGIQNVSSCTGNHTLHAVGVARAIKHYGGDEVAISSQGEASTSEGYVYEALNGPVERSYQFSSLFRIIGMGSLCR